LGQGGAARRQRKKGKFSESIKPAQDLGVTLPKKVTCRAHGWEKNGLGGDKKKKKYPGPPQESVLLLESQERPFDKNYSEKNQL